MTTECLAANEPATIDRAVDLLKAGELVAVPTETVYGLAGNGLDEGTVARIFAAKERPAFDPLILHVGDADWLDRIALPDPAGAAILAGLIERFWPGPLTLLLPKTKLVPDLVTSGRPEVAVRFPANPWFQQIIRRTGLPLAAPSANRFGKVSPTSAAHVQASLAGRIPLIVDGGPCSLGLESTILRPLPGAVEILRPGPVTKEQLAEWVDVRDARPAAPGGPVEAPGQILSHYAPACRVVILGEGEPVEPSRSGLVCWGPAQGRPAFRETRSLSESYDLAEAAGRLFAILRELDAMHLEEIAIEPVPEDGIGRAIMDRVRRAAAPRPT